jgi:hypothetical protein
MESKSKTVILPAALVEWVEVRAKKNKRSWSAEVWWLLEESQKLHRDNATF